MVSCLGWGGTAALLILADPFPFRHSDSTFLATLGMFLPLPWVGVWGACHAPSWVPSRDTGMCSRYTWVGLRCGTRRGLRVCLSGMSGIVQTVRMLPEGVAFRQGNSILHWGSQRGSSPAWGKARQWPPAWWSSENLSSGVSSPRSCLSRLLPHCGPQTVPTAAFFKGWDSKVHR